jgi:NDP-sugar pyrophosphorylase family protein
VESRGERIQNGPRVISSNNGSSHQGQTISSNRIGGVSSRVEQGGNGNLRTTANISSRRIVQNESRSPSVEIGDRLLGRFNGMDGRGLNTVKESNLSHEQTERLMNQSVSSHMKSESNISQGYKASIDTENPFKRENLSPELKRFFN